MLPQEAGDLRRVALELVEVEEQGRGVDARPRGVPIMASCSAVRIDGWPSKGSRNGSASGRRRGCAGVRRTWLLPLGTTSATLGRRPGSSPERWGASRSGEGKSTGSNAPERLRAARAAPVVRRLAAGGSPRPVVPDVEEDSCARRCRRRRNPQARGRRGPDRLPGQPHHRGRRGGRHPHDHRPPGADRDPHGRRDEPR